MPVTAEQIEIAESHGMQNVELIAQCCNETGARFYIALAMLEKRRVAAAMSTDTMQAVH
jgi:hypothetical protein